IGTAGGVLYKVLGQKHAEAAEEQARKDKIENFRQAFMALDLATEDGAKHLIDYAEQNKATWEPTDFSVDVVSRTAKAKTFLEGLEERRTLNQRLEAVEATLTKAAELPPSEMAEARRRLEEIATKADFVGPEFVTRVAKDREDGDRVYVQRL